MLQLHADPSGPREDHEPVRGKRVRTDVPVDAPEPSVSGRSTATPPRAAATPDERAAATPDQHPVALPPRRGRRLSRSLVTLLWSIMLAVGGALLGVAIVGGSLLEHAGPVGGGRMVSGVGAAIVAACYTWGIAGRSGGRPVVFSALVVGVSAVVLATDDDRLRTGAAVMTAALSAVFAVMGTVPARRFGGAVRETLIATVISIVGGVAVVGWDPVLTVSRFQYAALALSLIGVFAFVYRLGAGLHGLGRRGILVVAVGVVMLAATLLYAEMIRRYGTPGLVRALEHGVAWSRVHLRGYPRPIEALLGIPALVWGTHMRARRRQGWWVCAFGVALTAPVACTLVNPELGVETHAVSLAYSLVVGIVLGFVVIRLDLLLTPSAISRATSAGRRAAREAEDATAVRPEPHRTQALL